MKNGCTRGYSAYVDIIWDPKRSNKLICPLPTLKINIDYNMHLVYFPMAGRAELIRLIAKVGGLQDLTESTEMPEGITKAS